LLQIFLPIDRDFLRHIEDGLHLKYGSWNCHRSTRGALFALQTISNEKNKGVAWRAANSSSSEEYSLHATCILHDDGDGHCRLGLPRDVHKSRQSGEAKSKPPHFVQKAAEKREGGACFWLLLAGASC
jgi:hypothetical protein